MNVRSFGLKHEGFESLKNKFDFFPQMSYNFLGFMQVCDKSLR